MRITNYDSKTNDLLLPNGQRNPDFLGGLDFSGVSTAGILTAFFEDKTLGWAAHAGASGAVSFITNDGTKTTGFHPQAGSFGDFKRLTAKIPAATLGVKQYPLFNRNQKILAGRPIVIFGYHAGKRVGAFSTINFVRAVSGGFVGLSMNMNGVRIERGDSGAAVFAIVDDTTPYYLGSVGGTSIMFGTINLAI